jgi:hypothetical protein
MPIRGPRNPMPKTGPAETGIFSSKGKQKNDGGPKNHAGLLASSLKVTGGAGVGNGGSSKLGHQPPKKSW